jgi:hypothetical protein
MKEKKRGGTENKEIILVEINNTGCYCFVSFFIFLISRLTTPKTRRVFAFEELQLKIN